MSSSFGEYLAKRSNGIFGTWRYFHVQHLLLEGRFEPNICSILLVMTLAVLFIILRHLLCILDMTEQKVQSMKAEMGVMDVLIDQSSGRG